MVGRCVWGRTEELARKIPHTRPCWATVDAPAPGTRSTPAPSPCVCVREHTCVSECPSVRVHRQAPPPGTSLQTVRLAEPAAVHRGSPQPPPPLRAASPASLPATAPRPLLLLPTFPRAPPPLHCPGTIRGGAQEGVSSPCLDSPHLHQLSENRICPVFQLIVFARRNVSPGWRATQAAPSCPRPALPSPRP